MMNIKFDIQYLISKKDKDKLRRINTVKQYKEIASPDGWILITIGEHEYGFLQEDDSLDGFELLDNWFNSFKDVVSKLKTESTVVLDYWDEPDEFFVFERVANYIQIKYFNRIYPITDGRMQRTSIYGINMIAETEVPEKEFFDKIKTKVNDFWTEVGNLNSILKGAFYFYADLTRKLNPNTRLEFMRIKSYEGENSTGKIDIKLDLDESIKNKDVLII